jgi:hypothetical protein
MAKPPAHQALHRTVAAVAVAMGLSILAVVAAPSAGAAEHEVQRGRT